MNYDIAKLIPKKLILSSKKQRVLGIYKKTNAKFYADIELGDILEFSIQLKSVYNALWVTVKNLTKGTETETSANQLSQLNILGRFQLEDIE